MLKIVVYDSGYGGELFADYLEEKLPVVEVIRVIDWRNAAKIEKSPRTARKAAKAALEAYIGRVDLIVFANFLLTTTSLKRFARKYKNQKFTGLGLTHPGTFKRHSLILTTKPLAKTISFHNYLHQLRHKTDVLYLDTWPSLIDDGELSDYQIKWELKNHFHKYGYPDEIILACSQFRDIERELREVSRYNAKIHDGFDDAFSKICRSLRIRGATVKRAKGKQYKIKNP